jgi:hypothetical protein
MSAPGVPAPAGGSATASGSRERSAAPVIVALTPLFAFVGVALAPGYLDPMLSNPPGVLGLPLGVVVLFVAGILTILGAMVVRRGGEVARVAAFGTLTIPAVLLVVLGPAVLLALLNLE